MSTIRTKFNVDRMQKQFTTLQKTGSVLSQKVNHALIQNPKSERIAKLSSYVNNSSVLLSRLGISQRLGKSFGDYRDVYNACGYPKVISYEDFAARYIRQDIAGRIVEAYPDATWRAKPDVYETDKNTLTDFEKKWNKIVRKVNAFHYFNIADKVAGIGRYGVLLLGLDDGRSWDQEPSSAASDVKYLQVYGEGDAAIKSVETDKNNERYGLPKEYSITTSTSIDGASVGASETLTVHWKRLIHIADGCLSGSIFGASRLERVYNRLQDLELLCGGSAEMFWRGGFPGIAFEAPSDADLSSDTSDLEDEIEDYIHGLNRYIRLVGLTAKPLSPIISDPTSHVSIQLQFISAATGIPQRILTGSERAELASTQDQENWSNKVDERRRDFAETNILRAFINRLIDLQILPPVKDTESDEEEYGYKVEWPDIMALSEKEQVDIGKVRVETAVAYLNGGVQDLISPYHFYVEILGWDDAKIEANLSEIEKAQVAEEKETFEDALDEEDEAIEEKIPSESKESATGNPPAATKKEIKTLGGTGSGNYGHAGIPGQVGGSTSGAGAGSSTSTETKIITEMPPPHLAKVFFGKESKPLRKKVSYGDPVMFVDGKNLIGGVVDGFDKDKGIKVKSRAGDSYYVKKELLRHPKGFVGKPDPFDNRKLETLSKADLVYDYFYSSMDKLLNVVKE